MDINVFSRKLNRTLLKKEGTKQFYLTAAELPDFFEISKEVLEQNTDTKRYAFKFYNKEEYLEKSVEGCSEYLVYLNKSGNEYRLTGNIGDIYTTYCVQESDSIILEYLKIEDSPIFLFSIIKNDSLIVIQRYSDNDVETIDLEFSDKGVYYWSWDDIDELQQKNVIDRNIEFNIFIENFTCKKMKIKKVGEIKKQCKATGISQQKNLYQIIDKDDEIFDFFGNKRIELRIINSKKINCYKRDNSAILNKFIGV